MNRVFSVTGFSFSTLWIYHAHPFWPETFLQRNRLIALWKLLVYDSLFFFCRHYNSLYIFNFAILIMIYLDVYPFWFILFGTLCSSYTWVSVSFFTFWMFLAIISSNTFWITFSLFLLEPLKWEFGIINVIPGAMLFSC